MLEKDENEYLRPGFVRVNIPYYASEATVQFVIDAVRWVAEHGWKMLPQYTFDALTGEWYHFANKRMSDRRWLGDMQYRDGRAQVRPNAGAASAAAVGSEDRWLNSENEG